MRIALASWTSNIFHPDEVFQTLEPAHRIAFGYGIKTWEWRLGVRSFALPLFLAAVMRVTAGLWEGSAGYRFGIISVLSMLSLSTIWFAYRWARRTSGVEASVVAATASASFFSLVYFAAKALTEVVAAHILLPGLYLALYRTENESRWRPVFAGFLCGIAGSLRVQLVPAIIFIILYSFRIRPKARALLLVLGAIIPIAGFGAVDIITWGYPWYSFINYVKVNLFDGRSLEYGIMPWHWYFSALITLLGPLILFLPAGIRRCPLLGIIAGIIFGTHSLLAHKELRFIYPILPLALVMACIGLVEYASLLASHLKIRRAGLLVVSLSLFLSAISSGYVAWEFRYWVHAPVAQIAFDKESTDQNLCGIGFVETNWWLTGGYSHLHRDVPIIAVSDDDELLRAGSQFNALVAPKRIFALLNNYAVKYCKDQVCLGTRPGGCTSANPDMTLDGMLRSTGN